MRGICGRFSRGGDGLRAFFISSRLNVKRQRFGFVRFQEVVDVDVLERKLNVIWIGIWKLRVNKPKYRRSWGTRKEWNGSHRPVQQKNEWRQKEPSQTYAQAVGRESHQALVQTVRKVNERNIKGVEEQNMIHIRVKEEDTKWLKSCYIGKVADVGKVKAVNESFLMEGFNFIRMRYLKGFMCCCLENRKRFFKNCLKKIRRCFA